MLTHLQPIPVDPARVVILGAAGFVGAATANLLKSMHIPTLPLSRSEVDLLASDAACRLQLLLRETDTLVVISARAPCKDTAMLCDNVLMINAVCNALMKAKVAHVIYISSDAVYHDSKQPLTESSCAEPSSLHGVMHLARELMLKSVMTSPLAILRPTLIYGAADPHNGYGPNRFRRLAAEGKEIVLFGEGEERRDHVLIDDVAELIVRVVRQRSYGALNIATGQVHSFRSIAECMVNLIEPSVRVVGSERYGPMPHGGYRAFDPAATYAAFADFKYTKIEEGLRKF